MVYVVINEEEPVYASYDKEDAEGYAENKNIEGTEEVLRTGGNDDPSEKDIVEAAFQNGYNGGHHYVVEADLDEVDDCGMITLSDGTEVEVADILDVLVD